MQNFSFTHSPKTLSQFSFFWLSCKPERGRDFMAETQNPPNSKEEENLNLLVYLPDSEPMSPLSSLNHSSIFSNHQTSDLQTLDFPSHHHDSSDNHHFYSELLAGAIASPTKVSPEVGYSQAVDFRAALDPAGFKGQFGMSHQEALASVTAQAHAQMQVHTGSVEMVPVSVAQSMLSAMSPILLDQEVPPVSQENTVCTPKVNHQDSSNPPKNPPSLVVETPSCDGYSWRKYGQKQVKSCESSRSYYKCTDSSCHAKKKIENCDQSGCIKEVIYEGEHNHEPPRKLRCTKASGSESAGPIVCVGVSRGSEIIEASVRKQCSPASSIPKEEPSDVTSQQKFPITSDCGRDAGFMNEEVHGGEPKPKRRIDNKRIACSVPQVKRIKDPKVVVQAAGDVEISGDGYRWRKYGQKMVKGNPNPRSYYKCTSAGCPVRKHVERAADEAAGFIITYEGKHDHDMPVPKKRHSMPSAALLIAAAAAVSGAQLETPEALTNLPSAQFSMEKDGEGRAGNESEFGCEKALEPAQTLLSIGVELKPC